MIPIRPVDVPTRATAAFLAARLPARAMLLEVGCGAGHVARELRDRGFRVLGIDADREAVVLARRTGVPVALGSWPDFRTAPVDAVAFTRVLHHIAPLERAIRRAREVLKPAGLLLLEEFAFDDVDARSLDWLRGRIGSEEGRRLLVPVPGEFITELKHTPDPSDLWRQRHAPDVHTGSAMARAVSECFAIQETLFAPYLYRYFVPVLPETPEAARFLESVCDEETRLGDLGELAPVGRRIVGFPHSAGSRITKEDIPWPSPRPSKRTRA